MKPTTEQNNAPARSVHSKILPDYCISGRSLNVIDGAIVHYFSAKNVDPDNRYELEVCRNLFLDLNRPKAEREFYMLDDPWPDSRMYASAHYLIGREGEIWRLVEESKQAYHAGKSCLGGRFHCNQWTIGIELVGAINSGFSRHQYEALVEILMRLEDDHGIPRENVAGHDFVRHQAKEAGIQASNKYDPSGRKDGQGDNFDWYYLGKMWNDRRPNPAGVNTIEDLDAVLEADPNSG